MLHKKYLAILLMLFYALSGTLYAKEYTSTSYYVAYDANDATQYVLVMPSVNKVYTHKAGKILPGDLSQIDTQFKSFPTYNNGELCFSDLKNGASGEDGASVMAGQCYDVNFFYTQKEAVPEGMAFILSYLPTDKVYEGLAGKADTFKVVREGDVVYNENSISNEDYSIYRFDKVNAKVVLGEELGSALVQGTLGDIVNPITGEVETGTATAVLELDMDDDGIFNGKADQRIEVSFNKGNFTLNHIVIPEGIKIKGQLTVTVDGYAPYLRVVTVQSGDSILIDASNALNKPALKEVVSLEGLSSSARMNSVVEFGIRKNGDKRESFSRLMSLSEFRAQADVPVGDGRVSTFTLDTGSIPAHVKTVEATLQAFDSTKKEDIGNFPGEFKGKGLNGAKFAADDEVGLESAAFDMFVLKDQNGKNIALEGNKDKLNSNVDLGTCVNTWTRYISDEQKAVIEAWGDYDPDTPEFEVPIWSNDNSESAWQFVGIGNYDAANSRFKVCIPDDWDSGYLNCDSPIVFEQPTLMCVNTFDQDGEPLSGLSVNGRTTTGQYAYGSTNNNGRASFELTDTNLSKWSFTYSGALTGWSTVDISATPVAVTSDECSYELNVTNITNPYTADVKVTAKEASGDFAANKYVYMQHSNYDGHYYYQSAVTDVNGTVHFEVEPNINYEVIYNGGKSNVNVDGSVVDPETADSGAYADVTVQDVNRAPYGYLSVYPDTINIETAQSTRVYISAYDSNPDTLTLTSLKIVNRDITLDNASESSSTSYYSQSGDLNISVLHEGNYEIVAVVFDGTDSVTLKSTFKVTGNRAPVIPTPLVAVSPNETINIDESGTTIKPDNYNFTPNVYDPDGDAVTVVVSLDGNEINSTKSIADGDHDVNITATDGKKTVSRLFSFTAANQKPVIGQFGISPNPVNLSVSERTMLYAFADDPDGDGIGSVVATDTNTSISYTLTKRSDVYWSLDINASEIGVVEGRVFEFVATDAASTPVSSTPVTASLTVRNFNQPPTFYQPMSDKTVHIGQVIQMTIIGEDAEGTRLSFAWTVDGQAYTGTPVDGQMLGEQSIHLLGLSEGDHVVACTITDAGGASASDSATVIVENDTPVFVKQPSSITAEISTDAVFECEATDQDTPVSYEWYVDGSLRAETGTSLTLNYSDEGSHKVYCKAKDKYDKTAQSNTATLSVYDPTKTHPLTIHTPMAGLVVSVHDTADKLKLVESKKTDASGTAVFNVAGELTSFSLAFDPNTVVDESIVWDELQKDIVSDALNNCNWYPDRNITECKDADWCTISKADSIPVWVFNAADVKDSNESNVTGESVDTNNDGSISSAELYAAALTVLDKNNDGQLSWAEINGEGFSAMMYVGVPIREYTFSFEDSEGQQPYAELYDRFCPAESLTTDINVSNASGYVSSMNVSGSGYGYGYLASAANAFGAKVNVYQKDMDGNYDFSVNMTGDGGQYVELWLDQTEGTLADGKTYDAIALVAANFVDYNITRDTQSGWVNTSAFYKNIRMVYPQWVSSEDNNTQYKIFNSDKLTYPIFGESYVGDSHFDLDYGQSNYYGDGTLQSSYKTSDYPMLDVNVTVDTGKSIAFTGSDVSKLDFTMFGVWGKDYNATNCKDEYEGECDSFDITVTSFADPTTIIALNDLNLTRVFPANIANGLTEGIADSDAQRVGIDAFEFRDKTGDEVIDAIIAAHGYFYEAFNQEPRRSFSAWQYNEGTVAVVNPQSAMRGDDVKNKKRTKHLLVNPFGIKLNMHKLFK